MPSTHSLSFGRRGRRRLLVRQMMISLPRRLYSVHGETDDEYVAMIQHTR